MIKVHIKRLEDDGTWRILDTYVDGNATSKACTRLDECRKQFPQLRFSMFVEPVKDPKEEFWNKAMEVLEST